MRGAVITAKRPEGEGSMTFVDWLSDAQSSGFVGTMAEAQTRWELGQPAASFCRPSETEAERAEILHMIRDTARLLAELVRLEQKLMSHRPGEGCYQRLLDCLRALRAASHEIEQVFCESTNIFKNRP